MWNKRGQRFNVLVGISMNISQLLLSVCNKAAWSPMWTNNTLVDFSNCWQFPDCPNSLQNKVETLCILWVEMLEIREMFSTYDCRCHYYCSFHHVQDFLNVAGGFDWLQAAISSYCPNQSTDFLQYTVEYWMINLEVSCLDLSNEQCLYAPLKIATFVPHQ